MALLLLLAADPAFSMRCGTQLVSEDDWPIEIREKCGEPDYVARYAEAAVPGLGFVQSVEHWYYNRGPQHFIRRLVFRDGRLRGVDTLGYGFLPTPSNRCSASSLYEGMSEYELLMQCGEPLSRRHFWQHGSRLNSGFPTWYGAIPIQEWLYEVGSSRFRRIVRLENGLVTRVTTGNRQD